MTDEARYYKRVGKEFAAHGTVDHSKEEYGRTEYVGGERVGHETIIRAARFTEPKYGQAGTA